jgi:hypothetical protein
MSKRWFEDGYEPEGRDPIEDLKRVVEGGDTYRENPLLVPAEMKDKFVEVANEYHIPVLIEGVWKKEKEQ